MWKTANSQRGRKACRETVDGRWPVIPGPYRQGWWTLVIEKEFSFSRKLDNLTPRVSLPMQRNFKDMPSHTPPSLVQATRPGTVSVILQLASVNCRVLGPTPPARSSKCIPGRYFHCHSVGPWAFGSRILQPIQPLVPRWILIILYLQ